MPCRGPGQRADRCLDVRCIHTPHAERRTDHLGYFPANVGAAVRSHKLWQWRQDRYSELVDLALERVVDAKEDTVINGLYLCKSGNHRSVLWALVEGWIMILLGAFAREVPICWWAQDRVKCQKKGKKWMQGLLAQGSRAPADQETSARGVHHVPRHVTSLGSGAQVARCTYL